MTCQNFKPVHKLKLPTRKIDNIFTKVDVVDKLSFQAKREREQ